MLSLTKMMQAMKPLFSSRIAASFQTSASAASPAPTLEEKIGLPPRPKRPLTPFFRFLRDNRQQIKQANPNLETKEFILKCTEAYKLTDTNILNRYITEYQKERDEYIKLRFAYETKLTADQRQSLADAKQEKIEKRKRVAHKKRLRENDKPKRPMSGFLRFLMEKLASRGTKPFAEVRDSAVKEWAAMKVEDKKKYLDPVAKEFETYKKDLAKWELKMVRLGNTDLVRDSAVIEQSPNKPKKRTSKKQSAASSDSD